MQTLLEREMVPFFHYLSEALLSDSQYESALKRALAIPDCPVVPFFGSFMRDIRKILKETPSSIVLSNINARAVTEVFKLYIFFKRFNVQYNCTSRKFVIIYVKHYELAVICKHFKEEFAFCFQLKIFWLEI